MFFFQFVQKNAFLIYISFDYEGISFKDMKKLEKFYKI